MTLYSPAQPRDRPRVGEGRRRFDMLTIGLHWATVTLIAGMFASAWLLLASDREHVAMLLTVHRSLGVVTWVVAIVRLGWRLSCAYLPPFPRERDFGRRAGGGGRIRNAPVRCHRLAGPERASFGRRVVADREDKIERLRARRGEFIPRL